MPSERNVSGSMYASTDTSASQTKFRGSASSYTGNNGVTVSPNLLEAIGIEVVYAARPRAAHQPGELVVAPRLVSERVRRCLVAVPTRVVEHKRDFVVVRCAGY